MRFVMALAFALILPLSACGGGTAATNDNLETTEGSAPVAATEEEVGGGTAQVGDDCDFGGAEGFTCRGGLVCCYPEEGEVNYGTCAEDCPGYD